MAISLFCVVIARRLCGTSPLRHTTVTTTCLGLLFPTSWSSAYTTIPGAKPVFEKLSRLLRVPRSRVVLIMTMIMVIIVVVPVWWTRSLMLCMMLLLCGSMCLVLLGWLM